MAQGALANVAVIVSGPYMMPQMWPSYPKTYLGQFWQRYGTGSTG